MAYNNIKSLLNSENTNDKKEPWKYCFEFEAEGKTKSQNEILNKEYKEKSVIERYFIYKATGVEPSFPKKELYLDMAAFCWGAQWRYGDFIADCDGSDGKSALTIDLYKTLWNCVLPEKKPFYGSIALFSGKFGGDTMNSVQTTMNCLMEQEIEKKKPVYKEERKKSKPPKRGSKYNNTSLRYCLQLYQKYGADYIEELEANETLKKYVASYHTLGNFVLVPAGFNGGRNKKIGSRTYTYDFWDSSLAWLKKFGYKTDYADFDNNYFQKYINYFFLWDYVSETETVDGKKYMIKKLFESHNRIEDGNDPKDSLKVWTNLTSKKEAGSFMENATDFIRRRGIFMTALLRLKTSSVLQTVSEKYFEYIQGEEFLSTAHENGFKTASEKLKNLLQGNESEEAEQILFELSMIKEMTDKEAK